jgi:hypothetical protein
MPGYADDARDWSYHRRATRDRAEGPCTTGTVVDIISQNSALSTSQPYGSANLSSVVAEVQTNSSGAATVTWSAAAYGGTELAIGAPMTLPTGMAIANATYIYGLATDACTPLEIEFGALSTIPLSDFSYWSLRISTTINYPYPS